jgi:hypothetical protein
VAGNRVKVLVVTRGGATFLTSSPDGVGANRRHDEFDEPPPSASKLR